MDSIVKDTYLWEVPTKATRKIGEITLKSNSSSIIRDTLRIRFLLNTELFIPIAVRINHNGLNFVHSYVDMGVLTQANTVLYRDIYISKSDHEYVVSVFNPVSYPVEIVDVSYTV